MPHFLHKLFHHHHYCVTFLFTTLDGSFDSQYMLNVWAKNPLKAEYKAHTRFPDYTCKGKMLTISSERID